MAPTLTTTAVNIPGDARPVRLFIVDDHAIVRDGLKMLISAQPDMEIIGEADSVRLALTGIRALQPPHDSDGGACDGSCIDVVIMDISLLGDNGSVATAKIRQYWPDTKVLAFSMHEDKSYVRNLLEAGAAGYILKRSATEELIRAIRIVASGGTCLDPSLSAAVSEMLVRGSDITFAGGRRQKEACPASLPGTGSSD